MTFLALFLSTSISFHLSYDGTWWPCPFGTCTGSIFEQSVGTTTYHHLPTYLHRWNKREAMPAPTVTPRPCGHDDISSACSDLCIADMGPPCLYLYQLYALPHAFCFCSSLTYSISRSPFLREARHMYISILGIFNSGVFLDFQAVEMIEKKGSTPTLTHLLHVNVSGALFGEESHCCLAQVIDFSPVYWGSWHGGREEWCVWLYVPGPYPTGFSQTQSYGQTQYWSAASSYMAPGDCCQQILTLYIFIIPFMAA